MKGLPVIIAAIGGALVGAATALLLAPRKVATHVPQFAHISAAMCPASKRETSRA